MNENDENTINGSLFIRETIENILKMLGVGFSIEVFKDKDIHALRFLIKTDEPNILIGHKGATLLALSHIIKRVVDKKFDDEEKERIYFIVDINNYQGAKIEELKTSAHMLAQRAMYFKNSVQMDPLTAYERMIVHSLFSESKDFNTISEGDGENRRIVIQYVGE